MNKLTVIFFTSFSLLSTVLLSPARAATVTEQLDDTAVASLVSGALIMDRSVPTGAMNIETARHEVELCGWVENEEQKNNAIKIAKDVRGVKKVYDALTVKLPKDQQESWREYVDDSVLTAKVKTKLINTHGVPAGKIGVVSYLGEVQLCGFVDNKDIGKKAVKTVKDMKDVKAVQDKLIVLGSKEKKQGKDKQKGKKEKQGKQQQKK